MTRPAASRHSPTSSSRYSPDATEIITLATSDGTTDPDSEAMTREAVFMRLPAAKPGASTRSSASSRSATAKHSPHSTIGGGWAVDALVGRQTREHPDLDLWVMADHLEPLFVAFSSLGLNCVFPWPGDRPWNFVLHDGAGLRVDLHLYEPISPVSWHYGSVVAGHVFPTEALKARAYGPFSRLLVIITIDQ